MMCAAEQGAFKRDDSVPHPRVRAAVQYSYAAAMIPPNGGGTPPPGHFFRPVQSPQVVLLQSSFHQLLQIVAVSRSGCVRLTYRNPGQVWHKGRVCSSSVQRSDQVMAELRATRRQQRSSQVLADALAPAVPPRRNDEIEKACEDAKQVLQEPHYEDASGPSEVNCSVPATWGLATGTNLSYSSIRVAWKRVMITA